MSKIEKFKFSKDFIGANAGDFKARLIARYGKDGDEKAGLRNFLTAAEVDQLVEREFKKDKGAEKLEADGNSTPVKGKTEATTK